MRTNKEIGNRKAFPKAVKQAALKASKAKANKNRSVGAIAEDFNVSKATLCLWRRKAGLSQAVPTGFAKHQAAQAATKIFNTPEAYFLSTIDGSRVVCDINNAKKATHIAFRGKTYKV